MKSTPNMAQIDTFNKKNALSNRQKNIRVFSGVRSIISLSITALYYNY